MRFIKILACLLCINAHALDLKNLTIDQIQQGIRNQDIDCSALIENYLNRIQQFDLDTSNGVPINAIVEINPSVRPEANQLDQYFKKHHQLKGPMHCVPVLVKDNIDTNDMTTTSGSLSMLGSQPVKDAFIISQLKNAGAIILAKSTMDEFASGFWGISSRSGRTGNAYNPKFSPGGSSSGSAAGVSADFAVIGIGSDNSGSLRVPASYNGLYTIRSSTGVISQTGIFPRGNLDSIPGPMAKTVKDLAITMDVIAKPDPYDAKSTDMPRPASYLSLLSKDALKGKRIGILTSVAGKPYYRGANKTATKLFQDTQTRLEQAGAVIVENIKLPKFNTDRKDNMAGEAEEINDYLKSFPSTRQNYTDICKSDRTRTFNSMKDCLKHVKETASKSSQTYRDVLHKFLVNEKYLRKVMWQNKLDALLYPVDVEGTAPNLAKITQEEALKRINGVVAPNSGFPSITIIAGYVNQDGNTLPIGMQLLGNKRSEAKLISMAYAFEQLTEPRKAPDVALRSIKPNLPPMNIPQQNNLRAQIGAQTYETVLKSANPQIIQPDKFKKIIKTIANDRG